MESQANEEIVHAKHPSYHADYFVNDDTKCFSKWTIANSYSKTNTLDVNQIHENEVTTLNLL